MLQVLQGRVEVATAQDRWEGGPGDQLIIPPERRNLRALESSAVLLTAAVRH